MVSHEIKIAAGFMPLAILLVVVFPNTQIPTLAGVIMMIGLVVIGPKSVKMYLDRRLTS